MRHLFLFVAPNLWMKISAATFGVLFIAIVFWVFSPAMKKYFTEEEQLPFDSE